MFFGCGAYVASAGSYCFYSLAVFQPFGLFEALCWSWCAPLLRAEAGSRPGGRGTFLCFAKETYPKERRPCWRIQKGRGSPTARTSTRAIAALGPARAAQGACARASGAERSDGPYGCLIRNPLLCVPRSADQAVAGVPQDTPASFTGPPRLSERSAQRAVSSAVHRLVEHRRLPRRPGAGVAHSRVAFSLVTFSWRSCMDRRHRKRSYRDIGNTSSSV